MRIVGPVTPATMETRRRWSHPSDGPAGAKRPVLRPIQEEEVERLPTTQPSDICTYWPPKPAFDPKRVLLRRMFIINEDKTKYMSVVSTRHAIINPWWNSAPFEEAGPIPSFSPTNKTLRWRMVCLLYGTSCVSARTMSSSARVATFVYTPQEARLDQAVCGHGIHKPDTT